MDSDPVTSKESETDKDPQGEVKEFSLNIPLAKSYVYSNVAAFSVSFMDIRISFGEAMPDQSVEARVGVVLPPENAAYIALSLLQQLNTFERNFGPIRHPAWQMSKKTALAGLARDIAQAVNESDPAPPEPEG